jgi:hypothetical protein
MMKAENKTDPELKRAQSLYEVWAQWSGLAVVIGLVTEVWLAIEFRPTGESFTHTWGSVIADVLVATGVFFEILFGRWAIHQGSELQGRAEKALAEATERAGNANARAAEAELRTAQLRDAMAYNETPRSLDENTFVEVIKDVPAGSVEILYDHNLPDALMLGMMCAAALQKAKWNVLGVNAVDPTKPDRTPMGIPEPYIVMGRGTPWGISIISKDDPRVPGNFIISKNDADPLWTELKGCQAAALAKAALDSGADRFVSIGTDRQLPVNVFRLVIGAKRRIWPGSGPIPGVSIPMPDNTKTTNANERTAGE